MNAATLERLTISRFTDHSEHVRLAGRWLGWIETPWDGSTDCYRTHALHRGPVPRERGQYPYTREQALDVLVEASANYDARRASTKVKRYPSYSR